jgi:predicted RNA-binding Zn-ribbon protein involved in translation (DUF1610 family)
MNWKKLFIYSAGGTLLAAALIRFLIVFGNDPMLALPEPMLGIPLRLTLLIAGAFELLVALICLFGRQASYQINWLTWLVTNYFVYRIGLLIMGMHHQGTCIGGLTDPLHLANGVTGFILGLLPFYLLLGSCVGLGWIWLGEVWVWKTADNLKMSCPACGVHIKFAAQNLGQKIPCPQCQKNITLRKPDLLKMACFFCREHIEFPSHAIGEKMPCPHCKMDITLKEPT